jgi:hypothetical protein
MLVSRDRNAGQDRGKKQETDLLKMYHSSNIWERHKQIKI